MADATNQAMANPANSQAMSPLAQLHDIVLPEPVSSLPIAPGYWLMLALVIFSLLWLINVFVKQTKYHAPRKSALAMLNALDRNADDFASQVNSLLKRTAMTYLPRFELAKLNGQQWFAWLELRLPANEHGKIGPILIKRHQAAGLTAEDKHKLFALATLWLQNKTPFEQARIQSQTEASC
ncbi:DUF4381 domain-containing protein [Shewanella aestuarii]|uniref:DUF4381 domain-containing protein n=2 Tax=Shewanella aestuarii TaxID=1028752 RepID=A0A6G9QP75_9GAMM|nr:DUF4381 domain-containing protein [Shewanella aestuarii]